MGDFSGFRRELRRSHRRIDGISLFAVFSPLFLPCLSLAAEWVSCYNEDMFSRSFFDRIPSRRGKALYVIACGERLTKLDVKARAGLSMSTVLSAVDSLRRAGLITLSERRVPSGGKPHSVIDVAQDRCAYGVAFRAGVLYAVALDLRGKVVARRSLTPSEGVSPLLAVSTLLSRLSESAPAPLAVGLAVNAVGREELVARLSEEYGAAVLPMTGTLALAYRALWQGAPLPFAVIGVGSRVKCAILGEADSRSVDLSDLTLSPAFSEDGAGVGALLCSSRVCRDLSEQRFDGRFSVEKGDLVACRDLSDYSSLLIRAFSGVIDVVNALIAPREIRLFGEYVTSSFFDRIRSAREGVALVREEADGVGFAVGAATAALTEGVFN